jgi:hypothetical protein
VSARGERARHHAGHFAWILLVLCSFPMAMLIMAGSLRLWRAGYDPIDAGPLKNAQSLESLAFLNIQLGEDAFVVSRSRKPWVALGGRKSFQAILMDLEIAVLRWRKMKQDQVA